LKALQLEPMHGFGISIRNPADVRRGAARRQGSLYPRFID